MPSNVNIYCTLSSITSTCSGINNLSFVYACDYIGPSQVDYMDENEEYFQRQASHRQSRRRFRKINQKGERQTIIDTVDPYPVGKPPLPRGYHTVSNLCALL